MDSDTKREIIMEHYMHPNHRVRKNEEEYTKVNTANSSCIDNLDIYIKFNGDIIEDISFDGEACAISISATSIMIENLIGKTFRRNFCGFGRIFHINDDGQKNRESGIIICRHLYPAFRYDGFTTPSAGVPWVRSENFFIRIFVEPSSPPCKSAV